MSGLDWDDVGDDEPDRTETPPEGGAEPPQAATAPAPAVDETADKRGQKIASTVTNKMLSDLGMGKKEEPPVRRVYNPNGGYYGSGGYSGGYGSSYNGYQPSFDDMDDSSYVTSRRSSPTVRQGPGMRYGGGSGNFKGSAWGNGSEANKAVPRGWHVTEWADILKYIDKAKIDVSEIVLGGVLQKLLQRKGLLRSFLWDLEDAFPVKEDEPGLADDPDLEPPL